MSDADEPAARGRPSGAETDSRAARLLEEHATSVALRSGLPEPQRTEARLELVSHLHEVARARAAADGSPVVEQRHARDALAALGDAAALDQAFFAPHRARVQRAPFGPRMLAYGVDVLVLLFLMGLAFTFLDGLLTAALSLGPGTCHAHADEPWFLYEDDVVCTWNGQHLDAPLRSTLWNAAQTVLVLAYFAGFERATGQTPGKMALRLRTTDARGQPPAWGAALGRNLTKVFPPLIALDALLGHFASGERKERLSDRLLRTAVTREAR